MNYIYTQTPYIYENSRDIYDNIRSATAKCFVNHQYSVPSIFQRVNCISILNKVHNSFLGSAAKKLLSNLGPDLRAYENPAPTSTDTALAA